MFLRLFGVLLVTTPWLLACDDGADPPVSLDAGPPTEFTHRLEWLSASPIELVFGESKTFRVHYEDGDGNAVPDSIIAFALIGEAHDTSLSAVSAQTNSAGRASAMITGGTSSTAFELRVSAEGAESLLIPVGVSDLGFGRIMVTPTPTGLRPISTYEISVFAGGSCDALGVANRTHTIATGSASFGSLPAGITYAVGVIGRSSAEVELGFGCTDMVTLESGATVPLTVNVVDYPLVVDGRYDSSFTLDVAASAIAIRDALDATAIRWIGEGTEGGLYLTALEATLRSFSETEAADELAAERAMGPALDNELSLILANDDVGISATCASVGSAFIERVMTLQLSGEMVIVNDPTLQTAWVSSTALVLGESGEPLMFDDAWISALPAGGVTVAGLEGDDTIALSEIAIPLPLGMFTIHLLHLIATELGSASVHAFLEESLGCESLATWIGDNSDIFGSACNPDCVALTCATIATELAAQIDTTGDELDTTRASIVLSSDLALTDADADLSVDTFTGSSVAGEWTAVGRTDGDPVTGSLSGARGAELP